MGVNPAPVEMGPETVPKGADISVNADTQYKAKGHSKSGRTSAQALPHSREEWAPKQIGSVIGAVVGAYFGNAQIGMAIGGAVGEPAHLVWTPGGIACDLSSFFPEFPYSDKPGVKNSPEDS